jgi:hypothetical protein
MDSFHEIPNAQLTGVACEDFQYRLFLISGTASRNVTAKMYNIKLRNQTTIELMASSRL